MICEFSMGKDLGTYHRFLRGIPLIIITTLIDLIITSVFSQSMLIYLVSLNVDKATALVASVIGAIFCYSYICFIRNRISNYIKRK